MEIHDFIMVFAVLLGPILAVQAQKILEKGRNDEHRKLHIFKTLMSTRASRLSIEHVQALNMIDVEFNGNRYKNVVNAWRNYHDHLNDSQNDASSWRQKNDELFIELLSQMGKALGYEFGNVMLKRTAYSPNAHGEIEFDQHTIRKGLVKILNSESSFPVFFTNDFSNQNANVEKEE